MVHALNASIATGATKRVKSSDALKHALQISTHHSNQGRVYLATPTGRTATLTETSVAKIKSLFVMSLQSQRILLAKTSALMDFMHIMDGAISALTTVHLVMMEIHASNAMLHTD